MSVEQASSLARNPLLDAEDTSMALGELAQLKKSPNQTIRNLRRFIIGNRLNLLGLCIVVVFLFLSAFGAVIAPYDPSAKGDIINEKLIGP